MINSYLKNNKYIIPEEINKKLIDVLSSFSVLNEKDQYLFREWKELIQKLLKSNPIFGKRFREKILEGIGLIPLTILKESIGKLVNEWLEEDYKTTWELFLIGIQNLSFYNLTPYHKSQILNLINFSKIKNEDIIELCKINLDLSLKHIIHYFGDDLIRSEELSKIFYLLK